MSHERRMMNSLLLTTPILLAMAIFTLGAAENVMAQEEIVCIRCHGALPGRLGEPVKLWRGSIHAANGIACNDCHGGDPKDAANAMSPARGFLGAPKETAIPAFCGRRHIDRVRQERVVGNGQINDDIICNDARISGSDR